MVPSLPTPVFDTWLRRRDVAEVVPVGTGLSGALLFAAGPAAGPRRWALRGWPSAVTPARVEEVHRVMRLAHRRGCGWMPRLELPTGSAPIGTTSGAFTESRSRSGEPVSWVLAEGRVWDCCQWMPGSSPGGEEDLLRVIHETAAAVAEFHLAIAELAEQRGPAPAVLSRLERLGQLEPLLEPLLSRASSIGSDAPPGPAIERAVQCLRRVWSTQLPRARAALEPWANRPVRQQYVFRDIHLGNTLFVAGRLSGIIDYDAVRVDSPATDLARLIGSVWMTVGPERWEKEGAALWSAMLVSYRRRLALADTAFPAAVLSADEERLAGVLADVSPLIVLANWVVWVVLERRSFPGPLWQVDERIDGWTKIVGQQVDSRGDISLDIDTR